VKRFEERVGFDQLKEVTLDRDVVEQVVDKLGALSRHIDAHLHSDAFTANKPTPEMLLEEIDAYDDLRKRHKESKKAAVSAAAKPVAKPAAESLGELGESVPDVSQPGTVSPVNSSTEESLGLG
jgi:predicted glycoside hydrolase/deacetylase ChbG (UPF0249 family)